MPDKIVKLQLCDGQNIQTFAQVLLSEPDSRFSELLRLPALKDKKLIRLDCTHRNGDILRIMVDLLRQLQHLGEPSSLIWPDEFTEWKSLAAEAKFWKLKGLEEMIQMAAVSHTNTITVSCHAALSTGKSGGTTSASDLNFRRIQRILVHGQVWTCREVFGSYLNENRDGNADFNRYTSRFYLTHGFLEQAFDMLAAHRFRLVASTSHTPLSGYQSSNSMPWHKQILSQSNSHSSNLDRQFLHYAQFVFLRTN